jgi:hypothetical protein
MITGFSRDTPRGAVARLPHVSKRWMAALFSTILSGNFGLFLVLLALNGSGVKISDAVLVVCVAIMTFSIVVLFAVRYWRFRRTHTPEERAALAGESQLRRDRINFADRTTSHKREVLRTGAEARAVITAVTDLQFALGSKGSMSRYLVYLELAVTVGADPPYAVCAGEYLTSRTKYGWRLSSLWVGRELAVRVDPNNRERVAVDWTKSQQVRQAPASQLRLDLIKFADSTTSYKRKVLRTGTEARAVITAVTDLQFAETDNPCSQQLVYLELAVTLGADPPYAVCTGEYTGRNGFVSVSSLTVGRELAVRVDPTDRQRVAVDWKRSAAPALRLQELERLRATGAISGAEYTARREEIIADT